MLSRNSIYFIIQILTNFFFFRGGGNQLLTYDPSKALPVQSFPLSILPEAHPSINCFQALDYLYVSRRCYCYCYCFLFFEILLNEIFFFGILISSQTGRAHLILVSITPGKPGGAIGIITLEGEFFLLITFLSCFVLYEY